MKILNASLLDKEEITKISPLFAEWISEESSGTLANMLSQSPKELTEQMKKGLTVVAINDIDYLGHATVWTYKSKDWAEVGSFIVHPLYRKKGIGKKVISEIVKEFSKRYRLITTVKTVAAKKAFVDNNFQEKSFGSINQRLIEECCPCYNPPTRCPKRDINCRLLVYDGT